MVAIMTSSEGEKAITKTIRVVGYILSTVNDDDISRVVMHDDDDNEEYKKKKRIVIDDGMMIEHSNPIHLSTRLFFSFLFPDIDSTHTQQQLDMT
mmetsp:Transcript_34149/g.39002  ORF Transcript_34149/g.39002 Transcript_34149/m.39002 type:complete len:95 (-) Transcript_34149:393-677(-)